MQTHCMGPIAVPLPDPLIWLPMEIPGLHWRQSQSVGTGPGTYRFCGLEPPLLAREPMARRRKGHSSRPTAADQNS